MLCRNTVRHRGTEHSIDEKKWLSRTSIHKEEFFQQGKWLRQRLVSGSPSITNVASRGLQFGISKIRYMIEVRKRSCMNNYKAQKMTACPVISAC